VRFTADQRPSLDRAPVAGLHIGIFGFQDEPGIDGKVQRGFVLKADVNRMGLACREDLHKIDELAFDLFKAIDTPPAVAANGGLAALRFGESE